MAFGILPRIGSVDHLITPEHHGGIREGHPEVSFAVLNGNRPLAHAKDTREGREERKALLIAAGVPAFDLDVVRSQLGKRQVDADDILDAAVMLVSARDAAAGTGGQLPVGGGDRRSAGS